MLPGFVPPACNQRGSCEQGRSVRFKRKLVGPAKPKRREGADDRVEVRLADSTPRSGEPATWGSGQRKLNCSWATWAPCNGRTAFYAKRRTADHGNGTRTNSSESSVRAKTPVHIAGASHHARAGVEECSDSAGARPQGWMVRGCRRRRRALRNGLGRCSNRFTARDIGRRIFGASISRNPASRRSARWACRLYLTGRSSEARLRYFPPYMSRTFCHARLADGLGWEPITHWQPSMR